MLGAAHTNHESVMIFDPNVPSLMDEIDNDTCGLTISRATWNSFISN